MALAMKVRTVKEIEVEGLGAKIKAAREADQRSLTELAKLAGISRGYWYDVEAENMRAALSLDTLRAIEAALGIDLGVNL